jgi:hypothetical protein
MARQFLTGLDLNKNQLLNARIQNLANAPDSPVAGQIYYNTGDNTLRYYNGTSWLTLAQGGSVGDAINAAIDLITTTVIEEGTNLYYTEERAKTDAAELLTGATLTNITITGDGDGLTITAENGGIQDLTGFDTDDLTEGTTNKYFTDTRAKDAVAAALGDGIEYETGSFNVKVGEGLDIGGGTGNEIVVDRTTVDTWYDEAGAAAEAISDHNVSSGVHGVTGNVVGTTDSQTLTNKALGSGTSLSADVDANGNTITDLGAPSADSDAATKGYVDTEIGDHADDTSGVHGVTGNVVGTTDTQTLTNKTLGSGSALSADLSAGTYKITNLGAPVDATDAATKGYVDSVAEGLHVHASVKAATTGNVNLGSGVAAVDGVTINSGDRVLVRAQTNAAQNGIYVSNGTTLSRALDYDTAGEIDPGDFVFVDQGATYGNAGFVQTEVITTLGTDNISWVQFSGAGTFLAGDGLTLDGNVFNAVGTADRIAVAANAIDIASTYVGQASITTVGTIATGTWNGTTIAVANGGTGATTAAGARTNLGATTKYTEVNPLLEEVSGNIEWTVEHNLGTQAVIVQVYELEGFEQVEVAVERTNTNEVTLRWVSAVDVAAEDYQVVIIG